MRLREENTRVKSLQEECQKQLDRLNRESQEKQKAAAAHSSEMKKMKEKLNIKSDQIKDLNQQLEESDHLNSSLQEQVKALTEQLDELTDRQYTCSSTQTASLIMKESAMNTDNDQVLDSTRETRCRVNHMQVVSVTELAVVSLEKEEETKHFTELSEPALNKSSNSCDIIAQAIDSPTNRKSELSNRLRNSSPPDSQRQMTSSNFGMPVDNTAEEEDQQE